MPVNRIVLLVVVGGGLALFAVSNLSPALPLVFLGMKTIPLPLAMWIGFAIAAGASTSFFLQLLSYQPKRYSTQRREEPDEVPPRRTSFRREPPQTPEPEPQSEYTPPPPPPETPTNRAASDWEERSSKDWDFREEPAAPTSRAQDVEDWQGEGSASSSGDTSHTERTDYEVPQEPKTSVQSRSTYSYSYRETPKKESGVGRPDVVYDANYRVITPPYQKPPARREDEEDWGFEDDEDFNDEVERNSRRE